MELFKNPNILIALISGALGLATGLFIPFANWHIEKLKQIRQSRKILINNVREYLRDNEFSEVSFAESEIYSSIRPYFSKEMIEKIEVYKGEPEIILLSYRDSLKFEILDDIAKIEANWGLI